MAQISFNYRGKEFTGYIVSSTTIQPYYHWFYFDDEDMAKSIDECIGFTQQPNNELKPTRTFVHHADLVETLKMIVQKNLGLLH